MTQKKSAATKTNIKRVKTPLQSNMLTVHTGATITDPSAQNCNMANTAVVLHDFPLKSATAYLAVSEMLTQ